MAAATYTTDLTTINILDSDTAPTVGEPTGSVAGTTIAVETDHYVVSTACISKIFNATGVGGLGFLNGTAVTVPADGAVYMWTNFLAPNAISVQSSGGMQILVGNTLANYKRFYVYGDDTVPYGGWQVNAVNPANTGTNIVNQGTPNGTWQYFGMAANVEAAVARGYPLAWDAVRAGRGSIIAVGGDLANGYATFAAIATKNDLNTTGDFNRWGIFSSTNGTYTLQGRLALGQAGTAVDFRDSNRAILIKKTEFVTAAFNQIEILNASSRVDWTGISIASLGTVSKGRVIVTDNADVNLVGCTFTDMSTFLFKSNTSVDTTTFRRCEQVTPTGAQMSDCIFEASSDTTGAIIINTPSDIANMSSCTFTNNNKAVKITAAGTYTFNGHQFIGNTYHVDFTGTGSCIINPTNGSGVSQGSCIATGGGSITVNTPQVTFTASNIVYNSEVRLYKLSDDSLLAGVENIGVSSPSNGSVTGPDSDGRYSFSYSHTLNEDIKVIVINTGDLGSPEKNYQAYYQEYTLATAGNQSLLVSQLVDRNFANP